MPSETRGVYATTQQVLFEEVVKFLLLERRHQIDLCTKWLGLGLKVDHVVPLLPFWEFIEGLLREHIPKAEVWFW